MKLVLEVDKEGGMDCLSPGIRVLDSETKALKFIVDVSDFGHSRDVWPRVPPPKEESPDVIGEANAKAIKEATEFTQTLIDRFNAKETT